VQREAAIALGRLNDPAALTPLMEALEGREPVVQEAVLAAFGRLRDRGGQCP
jgi:HEAT repeat protein